MAVVRYVTRQIRRVRGRRIAWEGCQRIDNGRRRDAQLSLQRLDPECEGREFRLGRLLSGASIGGQFLHGGELLAARDVELLDHRLDTGREDGLSLVAQAGKGGEGTLRHSRQIVHEAAPLPHSVLLPSASSAGCV